MWRAGSYEQELRPRAEIVYRGGWEDSAPTQIFLNFWNRPKRVIFGLHVNTDKGSSRSYDLYPVDGI